MGDYGAWKAMQAEQYQEECAKLRKEIVDITARSIEGRMEAWDLIDRMIEYVQIFADTQIDPRHRKLLEEIEEKRKPHG